MLKENTKTLYSGLSSYSVNNRPFFSLLLSRILLIVCGFFFFYIAVRSGSVLSSFCRRYYVMIASVNDRREGQIP